MSTDNEDDTLRDTSTEQSEPRGETGAAAADHPLGYWLHTVGALTHDAFAAALDESGEGDRRDALLLGAIAGDGPAPLRAMLRHRPRRLVALAERGWITHDGDAWVLTESGRAEKERIDGAIGAVGERIAGSVSPADYATTLATLEAIARELGWPDRAPRPRGRFADDGRRGFGFGRRRHDGPPFAGHFRHGHPEADGFEGPAPFENDPRRFGPRGHRGFERGGFDPHGFDGDPRDRGDDPRDFRGFERRGGGRGFGRFESRPDAPRSPRGGGEPDAPTAEAG